MTCRIVNHGGGLVSIVCMRGDQTKPCHYCGRPSEKLCDYPLRGPKAGKTCDILMCSRCATHDPPDKDYCKAHAPMVMKERDEKLPF
jgi:hypothetical protein